MHFIRKPHKKDIVGPEVIKLRKFLTQAGWSGSEQPSVGSHVDLSVQNLMVVVDVHDAKIYTIASGSESSAPKTIKPYDPHHFLHHLTHKDQFVARGQRAPEHITFHEAIATALTQASSSIIVGHGKGKSNAANHISDYLRTHYPDVAGHITRRRTSQSNAGRREPAERREGMAARARVGAANIAVQQCVFFTFSVGGAVTVTVRRRSA